MLKKFFLITILPCTFCFALTKNNIKIEMTNKINDALLILKNSKLSKEEKVHKIMPLVNPIFDYNLMGRLALGKVWNTISKKQRQKFTEFFIKKLKASYVDKLWLYTNEQIKILNLQKPKKNRIIFAIQILSKDEKYNMKYKFYKVTNSDNWLIYDVNLMGVSIVQTYRQQFSQFLKNKSFEKLLVKLKSKK